VLASFGILLTVSAEFLGAAGSKMKSRMKRWLLGLAALFMLAGVYTPLQATAETHIVVSVGHVHHRHYRRHYVVVYRHGRRYRSYR
jgi:hypothetical protein